MRDPEEPFDAPWQAQLFAMTVAMNEAGLFEWTRWAETFGSELKRVRVAGNGAYYLAWLCAFERLLVEAGHASEAEVSELTSAWHAAAHATPHGEPIVLGSPGGTV